MLFRDALTKVNLLRLYVQRETNALYMQGIDELELWAMWSRQSLRMVWEWA
ncbi:hypothetical protein AGMMS50229_08560 [Campylobacterota bacterium]|nr:hypothetical protein AGMMS50229_08250 [Campylobacterota bacterium]GHV05448.1 hypothetical protein AGMMS50229_08560 [Campylobacterota bacterium]